MQRQYGRSRHLSVRGPALAVLIGLVLVSAGCAAVDHPSAPKPEQLAADAPAARGLPALPGPDAPSPLKERAPFGLYAHYPANDTLNTLATGTLSPDGRFRTALTSQSAWVARIDGAWIWEIQLPAVPVVPQPGEKNPPPQTSAIAEKPPAPVPAMVAGEPRWTYRGTLLIQDESGTWYQADPTSTDITTLAPAFKGRIDLTLSPDGTQALYYSPGKTGRQLWTAKADGTNARLAGENLSGWWDAAGKLVTVSEATVISDPRVAQGPGSTLDRPGR